MTWTRSLKFSLRSLGRELVRNIWGRLLVYPALARNERSRETLARYVADRASKAGVPLAGDPCTLPRLAPDTPLLTKQDVRQHPERLLRPRRFGSLIRTTIKTSGTSGTPLTIVQSLGNMVREEGFVYRQLRWIGWRPGQRRAWIRGDIVCADDPSDGRYWCRDWVGNMLMMSSYHLSDASIGAYVDALEAWEPVVIHAYPSSIAALAAWLNARGRRYGGKALRGVVRPVGAGGGHRQLRARQLPRADRLQRRGPAGNGPGRRLGAGRHQPEQPGDAAGPLPHRRHGHSRRRR
jgi:phenylacetate-CoA ligase